MTAVSGTNMKMFKHYVRYCLLLSLGALAASCGSPNNPGNLGGTITGLTTGGLVLANGSDRVSPSGNSTTFTFPTAVASGAAYSVSVETQPTNVICTVTNGTGVMGSTAIKNVTVTCVGSSVSTLAGSGANGFANGTGRAASFNAPAGIALDAQGNVYVADRGNNVIRKITPAGAVTTFAGNGTVGAADGSGNLASFNNPAAVAVSNLGNVFVADSRNNLIRMVTPAGVVTTFAGNGAIGAANGTAATASFSNPSGVAVDNAGNVYVADTGNALVRAITPAGVVTTLAGSGAPGFADGTGAAASFDNPTGIAIDATGNLLVADKGNNRIRMITPAGIVSTFAGSGAAGSINDTGIAASFNNPTGIGVSSAGNIFVADSANNLIRRITSTGAVNTLAGTGSAGAVNGRIAVASFSNPGGVAADGAGNVYVADSGNSLIRLIASQ